MSKSPDVQSRLRQLPSITQLLNHPSTSRLLDRFGTQLTTDALRDRVDQQRHAILAQELQSPHSADQIIEETAQALSQQTDLTLHSVINATGVVIHTNLGRATLSSAAQIAVADVAGAYSTLEFNIESGKRGKRDLHPERLLQQVTGAEAALVVNNTAASVMMLLATFCIGKEVIISRGQLVEIGGGFRVPDVMAQSGAILREVGTTNRTHLRDYEQAINENTAAIMIAHHSNFKIVGFTTEPSLADICAMAHRYNIPVFYDQGSGCLLDTAPYGLDHEPTVLEGVDAGCDLIAFSGDKLLGGPQAGVICGRTALVQTLKRHPLARALRPDKLCLAGLTATLTHYLKNEALDEIPVWRMISMPLGEISKRAHTWRDRLSAAGIESAVIDDFSTVGGGSLPGTTMPTQTLALAPQNGDRFMAHLRTAAPHVIGRLQEQQARFDPRTVAPGRDDEMVTAIIEAWNR